MLSLLRAVFGPTFNALRSAPLALPEPDRPPKLDTQVSLVAVDADAWTIKVGVPPYDLASHNLLAEVRVYLLAPGSGQPGTASEYLDSPYPYAVVDLRESRGGIEVVLPLPEVEPADYFGQIVLLFDDSAVEPEPPSEDAATS